MLGYSFCEMKVFHQHPVMKDRKEMFLEDLCVDESARGQGVATALYRYVCGYAQDKGCAFVTLNVWQGNDSALRFYEKRGLKPQKIVMESILEEN